jgi:hypothetical protein
VALPAVAGGLQDVVDWQAPSARTIDDGGDSAFAPGFGRKWLERDDFSSNRHPALSFLLEHDLFANG